MHRLIHDFQSVSQDPYYRENLYLHHGTYQDVLNEIGVANLGEYATKDDKAKSIWKLIGFCDAVDCYVVTGEDSVETLNPAYFPKDDSNTGLPIGMTNIEVLLWMLQPVHEFIDIDSDHFMQNEVAVGWQTNFEAEVDYLYGVSNELEALYPTLNHWIKDDTVAAWHKAHELFDGATSQFVERATIEVNGRHYFVPEDSMTEDCKLAIVQSSKLLIRDIHDILLKLNNTDDTKKTFPCCFISDKESNYKMQHLRNSLCYGPSAVALGKRPDANMSHEELYQAYVINMEKPKKPHIIHYAYGIGEQRNFDILHKSLKNIQMRELSVIMTNIFN